MAILGNMTPPKHAPTLDERKFEQEIAEKRRELDLREREVAAKETELGKSVWRNPLAIGLFVAAIGVVGNIFVAMANNESAQVIERARAQSTLILEALKTGDAQEVMVGNAALGNPIGCML